MRILISLILFSHFSLLVQSQKLSSFDSVLLKHREKKITQQFNCYAYTEAIEGFEKLIKKGYSTDSLLRHLAVSYYKTAAYEKAEDTYRKLINSNRNTPADVYQYIQSLKYNGKYEEADIWIDKYKILQPSDTRGSLQSKSWEFVISIKNTERCTITNADFNSANSDFGAVDYAGDIVFSSSRSTQAIINFIDVWKHLPYFAIYKVQKENASVLQVKFFPKKFNTIYNDGPVCFGPDENEIYVTRNNYRYRIPKKGKEGINNLKILHAKKAGVTGWSTLEELPFNSNNYSCGHPTFSADEKRLYFASDMPGGMGGTDLYYVDKTDNGWSAPVNLGANINTEGDEMFPFIQKDGTLYFSSNGRQTLGGLDIFVAKNNSGNFEKAQNMGIPMNSSADDFAFYLKPDNKSGFFASNRVGGKGDDDIYRFDLIKPVTFGHVLIAKVFDEKTKDEISGASVRMLKTNPEQIDSAQSGTSGEVGFTLEKAVSLSLRTLKSGYIPKDLEINPADFKKDTLRIDIPLTPIVEYGIYGNVFVKGTKEIVPDVKVQVWTNNTSIAQVTTNGTDNFRIALQPNTDYQVVFTKPGFLTKRVYYTTKGRTPGWVNINEFVDVQIQKLVIGAIIEIPNIYYDLAKWNIRADAAVELDKVVQFLNDNNTIRVELGSHTDSRGSDISNQSLSQKRAQSAVDYIVNHGININRITAKGYGESKLKNRCANGVNCTEEEHQQNRRTEIRVTGF